ncbi:MAG: T9SS type A sorting domain-containing protein [Candidatus Krumholzibacteria bacterium]|nr:T9SS type A sorting domain-containing protein [Candidatus Krumholzibacteria bacterium]
MKAIKILSLAATVATIMALAGAASAALGDHVWSQGYEAGGQAAADGTGNVACAGNIFAPTNFGGGVLTPTNIFTGDIYVARFDAAGAHLWSQQFTPGGGPGAGASVTSCTAGPTGNIYVAGYLQGAATVNFGGGVLSGASGDVFLAAFDAAGTHQWSTLVGAGTVRAMAASSSHVYVTGYTYGSMDFGGGTMTSAGGGDCFVGAMTSAGAHAWSALFGDASNQGGMALAVDESGNVILAAGVEGSADFGGGPLTFDGDADLCLVKFSGAGAHQWSQIFAGKFTSGSGILFTMGLAAGPADAIAVAGQASGTVNFGGGVLSAAGGVDAYLACFDAGGVHQTSTMFGGTKSDGATGVAYDASGNLILAGTFLSTSITFGGSPLAHSGGFGNDMFAAVFDASNAHLWSTSYVGGYEIHAAVFPSGDILLSGSSAPGVDFGGGPLTAASPFLAKLEGNASASAVTASPAMASLGENYPNPFNPATTIPVTLSRAAKVMLDVYDARGRRVATLFDGSLPAGTHALAWNGETDAGHVAPSGVYVVRLVAGEQASARRMVLLK